MRDLGLGFMDLSRSLEAEAITRRRVGSFGRNSTEAFKKALRSELWMNDLSLKRETLRFGALRYFAKRGAEAGPATEAELTGAKRCICRKRMALHWSAVMSELDGLGVPQPDVDAMVRDLALARRAAWPIVQAMDLRFVPPATEARAAHWAALGLGLESSMKPEDSERFSLSLPAAARCAEEIAKQIGIVRIGLVGELDTLGVHVAQAFAQRTGWSASFSSGKGETRDAARVGSIMEEVEIHAQDAFKAPRFVRAPFIVSCDKLPLINPRTLDLPYDSTYSDTLEIDWSEGINLLNCRKVLVPAACLSGERVTNDIYYSPRLGGKTFSTSGLGSGFSLAEATVHAAAEYIERHAQRLAEFEIDNPGGVGIRQFWFVDHGSLPDTPRRIVEKYRRAGMCVRILDITSEVAVPTFYARVFDDPFTSCCNPNHFGSVTTGRFVLFKRPVASFHATFSKNWNGSLTGWKRPASVNASWWTTQWLESDRRSRFE
jgi:ribosomal protein S12 methylthiotransferase accessory factor